VRRAALDNPFVTRGFVYVNQTRYQVVTHFGFVAPGFSPAQPSKCRPEGRRYGKLSHYPAPVLPPGSSLHNSARRLTVELAVNALRPSRLGVRLFGKGLAYDARFKCSLPRPSFRDIHNQRPRCVVLNQHRGGGTST